MTKQNLQKLISELLKRRLVYGNLKPKFLLQENILPVGIGKENT
jgi:hypothetical protein